MLHKRCSGKNATQQQVRKEIPVALLKLGDQTGSTSPPLEHEISVTQEIDSDWEEDLSHEEEDTAGEDSGEESLNNKLCIFTVTQKEFMNQHWYHCHTCKMIDGVEVCTVCAKVCHKDHDLTYAKFYSFFCDCGAKEDGSCKEETAPLPGQLLRPRPTSPPPDMSPFFLREFVKGHANDVFEDYPQLLTEMALRLPHQLKKIGDSVQGVSTATFDAAWNTTLAEYMMTQRTPFVKKQARKLLLFISGSRDRYREICDLYFIEKNLNAVIEQCNKSGLSTTELAPHSVILPYDSLLVLIEQLKACADIAASRPEQLKACADIAASRPEQLKACADIAASRPEQLKACADIAASRPEQSKACADIAASRPEQSKACADIAASRPEQSKACADIAASRPEQSKACADIAASRPVNWQKYCSTNQGVLPFQVKASISLDEGVAPTLLQLLVCCMWNSRRQDNTVTGNSCRNITKQTEEGQR
ncbi:E3 ubiquitin-protein ligase UBR4-like [Mercenaria mercenaria]|uniref:E3 ubiquitin-protein ligase UBR4-like n=1 Tax=Mercenaria mercenaria TaxID=6596 RepID=UPI00234F6830|nr:E3 ubiquitin-protein ligase UBR4-like [Mercenaria mercenaria]